MTANDTTMHPMRRLLANRRGLLAGAAALVGAGLAKLTGPDVAQAGTDGDVVLGGTSPSTGTVGTKTSINASAAQSPGFQVFNTAQFGNGIQAIAANCGIAGGSNNGLIAFPNVGVVGSATGSIFPSDDTLKRGVYGSAQDIGVHGNASGSGFGVRGDSTAGIGVYGQSTNNHGCGGASTAPGYSGLFGFTGVPGAAALLGVSGAANGTAGYFHGAVFVDGSFQVMNGPKAALVAHPDGSHRRVYCQEAPEPWFEDFGQAQLQGGRATVRLDPDFAAVVKADTYSVFPIPEGECKGLYILAKTPVSFEVRELQGGISDVPFSYRLVARRKDDVGKRLEKVDIPKMAPIDIEGLTRPAAQGSTQSSAGAVTRIGQP